MATEYTGEKVTVNYFPSLDSYNTNKDSLSETDINFVPCTYDQDIKELEAKISNAGMPVGFEYISFNPNIPTGSIPLLGGTFSRTAYADLWEWVQSQAGYLISEAEWQERSASNGGNVSCYSDGDGSTTFRVPSRTCWVKGTNNIEEVGSYLKAGLPNLTGTFEYYTGEDYSPTVSNAFSLTTVSLGTKTGIGFDGDGVSNNYVMNLDASDSNAIYGASDTVQPASVVGMWLVKAFGTVSNVGNQDIADVSAGLTRVEEKISDYTDNVSYIDSFIVESWVSDDGLSWYRKYNDGYIEQAGDAQGTAKNEKKTITLPTAFTTTNYCVVGTLHGSGWDNDNGSFQVSNKTTTSFLATSSDAGAYYLGTWYACGY